jgi:hypothetical protein
MREAARPLAHQLRKEYVFARRSCPLRNFWHFDLQL